MTSHAPFPEVVDLEDMHVTFADGKKSAIVSFQDRNGFHTSKASEARYVVIAVGARFMTVDLHEYPSSEE